MLAETLTEGRLDEDDWTDFPDPVHPADERRRREPRNYKLVGAYARFWFWSLTAMGLAFAVFLLLRLL